MDLMFRTWDWTSNNPVPWAKVDSDPGFRRGSPQLENVLAWRNSPTASKLIQKARGDFATCQGIETHLQNHGGYFVGDASQALQVSPDFFYVSPAELEKVRVNLDLVRLFWQQALSLYYQAVETGDAGLIWVVKSVDGPISPEQSQWQHWVTLAQPSVLPLFARADLSSIYHLVEIQERIGGLGLVESWLAAIRQVQGIEGVVGDPGGFARRFAEAVVRATGKADPTVVLVCPNGYKDEQEFFARALRGYGICVAVVGKEIMEEELEYRGDFLYLKTDGSRVDFLYRREINAASLALSEIGQGIMKAAVAGNLVVEPPLNMIYDCKTPMAWVHDQRVGTFFTSTVRSAITPTVLLPNNRLTEITINGEELAADDLIGRPFVVKYGGENIKYGFGGRAVYQTEDNSEGIDRGLEEVGAGHPWVVQPLDKTRFTVRQWVRDTGQIEFRHGAGRLMFHVVFKPDETGAEIVTACAQIRPNHWKAIGCPEAVFQDMRLK
jgi:hypothetical protein